MRTLLAGALALATVVQAAAADLPMAPPPAPAYVPVLAPVYNWGGFYFGVNGGYGFGASKWTDPNNPAGSTGSFNVNGWTVGPTIGVNFQTDAFVFGVEGDFAYSTIDGKITTAFCSALSGFGTNPRCETQNNWLATIRGRAGYAVDRVLFYGTAGGAFGNLRTGVNGSFNAGTEPGWTAGAGVEVAFTDNWTARLEYIYVGMANATCTTGNCGFNSTAAPNDTISFTTSLVRLGVDYKFR